MPALELVGNRGRHRVEIEMPALLRDAGLEYDLEQEVAEFVAHRGRVAALNRIGNFVGFLDRVRRNRLPILLQVPWAAGLRITQPCHDLQQSFEGIHGAAPAACDTG